MFRKCVLFAFAAVLSGAVAAHHGTSSQFDQSKSLEISGVITEIAFVNPHSYVYFDVTNDRGSVENWHCEMRAATVLRRSGWKENMFTVGTRISIVGSPSRIEPTGCYIDGLSLDDGEEIDRYDQIERNKASVASDRPMRLASGEPNISGDWAEPQHLLTREEVLAMAGPGMAMGPGMGSGMGGPRDDDPDLTAAGQGAQEALANLAEDLRLSCLPSDFFQDWTKDQHPNRVVQENGTITMRYGYRDARRVIYMKIDTHPENLEPSWAGHSTGRWEGDELVVDTAGFTGGAHGRDGVRSEQFHVVERFSLVEDGMGLKRVYTAEDSQFWIGTISGEQTVYLSDYPWELYACDDRTIE